MIASDTISPYPLNKSLRPFARTAVRSENESAAMIDAELVRRFKSGDDSAFGEIVSRHRHKLLSVAQALLRNHADAEDIAQDTFIRAYRGLGRFRGDSSLATWLHRITLNLSHNRYWYFFRRHRQDTRSIDYAPKDDSTLTLGDLVASSVPDPAREAVNREFSAHVALCMERLSGPQRDILALRNHSHRSYDQISEILGVRVGTVKSRIARARQNLRALLSETYPEIQADRIDSSLWFESRGASGLVAVATH